MKTIASLLTKIRFIVYTRQAQFKRTPKGWRPCNSDGRELPKTSDEYASWQLAQEGVSL